MCQDHFDTWQSFIEVLRVSLYLSLGWLLLRDPSTSSPNRIWFGMRVSSMRCTRPAHLSWLFFRRENTLSVLALSWTSVSGILSSCFASRILHRNAYGRSWAFWCVWRIKVKEGRLLCILCWNTTFLPDFLSESTSLQNEAITLVSLLEISLSIVACLGLEIVLHWLRKASARYYSGFIYQEYIKFNIWILIIDSSDMTALKEDLLLLSYCCWPNP